MGRDSTTPLPHVENARPSERVDVKKVSMEGPKPTLREKIGQAVRDKVNNPRREARSRFSNEAREAHRTKIQERRDNLKDSSGNPRYPGGGNAGSSLYEDAHYISSLDQAKRKALDAKRQQSAMLGLKNTDRARLTSREEHDIQLQHLQDFKQSDPELWTIYADQGLSFKDGPLSNGKIDWKSDPELVLIWHDSQPGPDRVQKLHDWAARNPQKAEIYRHLTESLPGPEDAKSLRTQQEAESKRAEADKNSITGLRERMRVAKKAVEARKEQRIEEKKAELLVQLGAQVADLELPNSQLTDSQMEKKIAEIQAKIDSVQGTAVRAIRIDDRASELAAMPENESREVGDIRKQAEAEITREEKEREANAEQKRQSNEVQAGENLSEPIAASTEQIRKEESKELSIGDQIDTISLALRWNEASDNQDKENIDEEARRTDEQRKLDGKLIVAYQMNKVIVATGSVGAEVLAKTKKGLETEDTASNES